MKPDASTHDVISSKSQSTTATRIFSLPFLNSRPLTFGLEDQPGVQLVRQAPSTMADALATGQAQVALLPVVDLVRLSGRVVVLGAGCIACDGPTLSTRIFSRVRPEKLTHLWVDSAARTSVALAKVLWQTTYGRRLSTISFDAATSEPPHDAQACLVVGDRVVSNPPFGYDWQWDLGSMWKEATGLPLVLAVWATQNNAPHEELYHLLAEARRAGQQHLVEIAHQAGPAYGWPEDLAERYLTQYLRLDFDERCREGATELLDLVAQLGIMGQPQEAKPLECYRPPVQG